jgi:5-methylcytosine-specific restriction endonuclease McrA
MEFNTYHLRRWSLLVRLRDDFTCHVCGEECKETSQAHHIYPKSIYPEKVFDLNNGITVCQAHHQPLVHAQWKSWRKWTDFFKRPLRRKANKKFNVENQHKVERIRV